MARYGGAIDHRRHGDSDIGVRNFCAGKQ